MYVVTFTIIVLLEVVVVQSVAEGEFISGTEAAQMLMKNHSMEPSPLAKENQEIQYVVVVQSVAEGEFSSGTEAAQIQMKNHSMEVTPMAEENQDVQFAIHKLGEVDVPLCHATGIVLDEEYMYLMCNYQFHDHGKNRMRTSFINSVRVHERNYPFDLLMLIVIGENEFPIDMTYREISNTLYITRCFSDWNRKITLDDQQMTRWLEIDYNWFRISLSADGNILALAIVNNTTTRLEIYGFDGILVSSLLLPDFIIRPLKVIQTPDGRFIICHIDFNMQGFITQLTRDGQFIGQFNPLDESQKLGRVWDMTLDPDHDLLLLSDTDNRRVVLLDSTSLTWRGILQMESSPFGLHYDLERRQLLVGDNSQTFRIFSFLNKT